jgi:hypothetical protein
MIKASPGISSGDSNSNPNTFEGVDILKDLDEIYGMMEALNAPGETPSSIIGKLPSILCPDEEGASPEDVMAKLDSSIEKACRLANAVVIGGDISSETDAAAEADREIRSKIQFVIGSMYYLNQAYRASTIAWRMIASGHSSSTTPNDADLVAGIARFAKTDPEEANRMQQLLLYLLNMAQMRGYRRRHGDLYRRISAGGRNNVHDTHAWERVCDMQEFVYETTRKEINYDMWLNLTCARVNIGAAIDHLKSCRDVQLPELHKDRHVFSFENGIYLAKEDRFCPYGSPEHAELPTDLVAAKFFPLEFEHTKYDVEGDWYDTITTPHLQSILDYQDMLPEVARWMYVLIGRILYDVNEMDGWQVIPFLKGAASSGKSTILTRVCRGFYEPHDVGTLSNNIERKFGLSALHDKLVFIGPEIKSDIALEQVRVRGLRPP